MRAMMMGAVAAVTLAAGGVQAATLQADLAVDNLIGYFDTDDPTGSGRIISDFSARLEAASPSLDLTGFGEGGNGRISTLGSLTLNFQGSVLAFSGQIESSISVLIDRDHDDGLGAVDLNYSTKFSGVAADGTTAEFFTIASDNGISDEIFNCGFEVGDAETLTAGMNQGNFVLDTTLCFDPLVDLTLTGPDIKFQSLFSTSSYSGSPYRVEVTSDSIPSPVPLPASVTLLGATLAGLGLLRRRVR